MTSLTGSGGNPENGEGEGTTRAWSPIGVEEENLPADLAFQDVLIYTASAPFPVYAYK